MRNKRWNVPHNLRGPAVLTSTTYGEAVRAVLLREFGSLRHAAELIARLANTTPRTVENWLAGRCAPQGAALLNLCATCKAVDDEMERLKALARGGRS